MITYLRRRAAGSVSGPPDYSKQYLTFEALESGTFSFSKAVEYSINNGDWTSLEANSDTPTLNEGDTIRWRSNIMSATYNGGIGQFSSTGSFNVFGNPLSLNYGNNFNGITTTPLDYNFKNLFRENLIVSANNLKLVCTTLRRDCYYNMFYGCTNLISAPELPALTLASSCYAAMFYGCSNLTTMPELPATTLANNCYDSMFNGCTSLTTIHNFPNITLANSCYSNMFNGCSSIKYPPMLPSTSLANYCYQSMFKGCTSMIAAPQLPSTTLMTGCYSGMFDSCSVLTYSPDLLAPTLVESCYSGMFAGCKKLTYIKCMATDISANNCLSNWVNNVSNYGVFIKDSSTTFPSGVSGIPSYSAWVTNPTLQNHSDGPEGTAAQDSITNYITFKCKSSHGIIRAHLIASAYQKLYISSDSTNWYEMDTSKYYSFDCNENYYLAGTTLTANTQQRIGISIYGAMEISGNCNALWNHSDLSASIPQYGGYRLFKDSSNQRGFGILTAPQLPATTLADSCYREMFEGSILQSAPELPATTLVQNCYRSMLKDCICLTEAPELPATTLQSNCYSYLFNGCSKLNYIKAMFTTTPSTNYTTQWVTNVASSGTFVKNSAATWNVTGEHGVPSGWTVVTYTP